MLFGEERGVSYTISYKRRKRERERERGREGGREGEGGDGLNLVNSACSIIVNDIAAATHVHTRSSGYHYTYMYIMYILRQTYDILHLPLLTLLHNSGN